jgi:hypothetical protein
LATRFEKNKINFQAVVALACSILLLASMSIRPSPTVAVRDIILTRRSRNQTGPSIMPKWA